MAIQTTPFEDRPYPYQAHGTFLSPSQGAGQGDAPPSLSPTAGSMFAPNQGADQPPPILTPTTPNVPQTSYALGPEGEPDAGAESKQFASGIGQGVLAASQSAAAQALAAQKKKGMGGMGGKMGGGGGGGAAGGVGAGFGSGGIMGGSV